MNHGKFLMIMALAFSAPKIHASELAKNYATNSSDSTLKSSTANKTKKKSEEVLTYEVQTHTDNYLSLTDEQNQFNELIGVYMHARDKVAHPVQIQTVDLKRKIAFNFEPTMLELEQGNVDANKIKFMLQLTAKFL